MTAYRLETGTSITFGDEEGRYVDLVCDDDTNEPMYYVAAAEGFRNVGVVENIIGVRSLMHWAAGNVWSNVGLVESDNSDKGDK